MEVYTRSGIGNHCLQLCIGIRTARSKIPPCTNLEVELLIWQCNLSKLYNSLIPKFNQSANLLAASLVAAHFRPDPRQQMAVSGEIKLPNWTAGQIRWGITECEFLSLNIQSN